LRALTLFIFFFVCLSVSSFAQGEQKFVTFSGFVIDSSVDEPLVGAYVINHRAGKGIQTNARGYFILDVFPGDSIVFSFMGFKPQYHIIPKGTGPSYSAVVELSIDAKMLTAVKVYPFKTEEEFKLAFLNMDSPNEDERRIIERNLGGNSIRALAMAAPMSSMGNYRYAIDQQANHLRNQQTINMNPLLNTASWINFIRDVKSGNVQRAFSKGQNNAPPQERNSRDEIFRANRNDD
jgi:hypothetical protein